MKRLVVKIALIVLTASVRAYGQAASVSDLPYPSGAAPPSVDTAPVTASTDAVVAASTAAPPFLLPLNFPVNLNVRYIRDLNLRIYGILQSNFIADNTQSFGQQQGNALVAKQTSSSGADSFAGTNGRNTLGIANSRIGFDLTFPKTDSGLQVLSTVDIFSNGGLRQAYLDLLFDHWVAKFGMDWSLLGWQPYYFPPEPIVPPGVGQLYQTHSQFRMTHTAPIAEDTHLAFALAIAPPADSSGASTYYQSQIGLRMASDKWTAASLSSEGTRMSELSAAISGALIPVRTSAGNQTGEALALDVFLPLIPSVDGKDPSNNLAFIAEFALGRGIGTNELIGLTAGVPSSVRIGSSTISVPSGVAGVNQDGNLELIRFRTWRSSLQYTLPGGRWTASAGYAQVEGTNVDRFSLNIPPVSGSGTVASGIAPKLQYGYLSASYGFARWLRLAAEASQTIDTYNDQANPHAVNRRYQFTTYLLF